MKFRTDIVFFLLAFIVICLLCALTEGVSGGADSYQHYLIAEGTLRHPELFFNHWGKPFFTLLAAPFCWIGGLTGMKMFNALMLTVSGLMVLRLLREMEVETSFLALPAVILVPISYQTTFSGLTEPTFAAVVLSSLYLLSSRKFLWAAILLSFLPYVRSEGLAFLPFMAVGMYLMGGWKRIPFLFTGLVLYGIFGASFYDGDVWWLFSQNPYLEKHQVYGTGDLLHYYSLREEIFTSILFFLGFAGFIRIGIEFLWKKGKQNIVPVLAAIFGAGYFIVHSILWWKGEAGSLGLSRIMAAVAPIWVLGAFYVLAFDTYPDGFPFGTLRKKKIWNWIPVLILTGFLVKVQFIERLTPWAFNFEEEGWYQSGEFVKNNHPDHKLYFYNPALCFFAGKDLFDPEQSYWMTWESNFEDQNGVLIWDAHFGKTEGGTDVEKFLFRSDLALPFTFFEHDDRFVQGGDPYRIYAFMKNAEQEISIESIALEDHLVSLPATIDNKEIFLDLKRLDLVPAVKGNFLNWHLELDLEFPHGPVDAFLVFALESHGETIAYQALPISNQLKMESDFLLVDDYPPGSVLKCYLWNKNSNHLIISDLKSWITMRRINYSN